MKLAFKTFTGLAVLILFAAATSAAIGGEKANGKLLGEQMKIVATDATMVVLKDCGHWVLEEKPKETTDALMKFL